MLKKIVCIGLVFSTTIASACQWLPRLPHGTTISIGPAVANAVQSNPAIATAIYDALNAWNGTLAGGTIGGYSGYVTGNDCPTYSGIIQIGALYYDTTTCPLITQLTPYDRLYALAYTDSATRSITVNLNYSWSLNPGPYDFDLQSVLAHEFGHVLGLAHQDNGQCVDTTSLSCSTSPRIETMSKFTPQGSTCRRVVVANDINSMNAVYSGGGF